MFIFKQNITDHQNINQEIHNCKVIYSNFIGCRNENGNGGAINFINDDDSENCRLEVGFSNFYECYSTLHGGSIYTNASFILFCSTLNNSQIYLHETSEEGKHYGLQFYSITYTKMELCSSHFCSGYASALVAQGSLSKFFSINQTNQYANYQTSGFDISSEQTFVRFITFVNLFDSEGCTLVCWSTQPSIVTYMNVFNCTSAENNNWGLFLFHYDTNLEISDSVFQEIQNKPIVSYHDENSNNNMRKFINCVFDHNLQNNFPSCTKENVTFLNNQTYIFTSVRKQCKIPSFKQQIDEHRYIQSLIASIVLIPTYIKSVNQ